MSTFVCSLKSEGFRVCPVSTRQIFWGHSTAPYTVMQSSVPNHGIKERPRCHLLASVQTALHDTTVSVTPPLRATRWSRRQPPSL